MDRREFLKFGVCAAGLPLGASAAKGVEGTLPVAGAYDLVVAGGSATGVCAAVTAARAGLRVALVEGNAFFGGTATAGLVPVWHSLWSTDGKEQIIRGLTEEIENRLIARGEAKAMEKTNPDVGCYFNVAAMQLVLDELVTAERNITPYLKAHVVAAEMAGPGRVASAVIEDKSGRRALKAKWFVDATGDADLAARAGFETWTLPKDDLQSQSLCAIFANVGRIREKYPKFSFGAVMKTGFRAGVFRHIYQWSAPVIGAPGLEFVCAARVNACDPTVAADLTKGLFETRRQVRALVDLVNRDYPMPAGERLSLVTIGSDLGVRESRHIKAKYRVTEMDVLRGRHFEDCIGRGTYNVDIHGGAGITFRELNGKEYTMVVDKDGEVTWKHSRWRDDKGPYPTYYEIPLSALIPEKAENLICAGRMIDCERNAYGALRVMVNCNQMGEAAANAVVKALRRVPTR